MSYLRWSVLLFAVATALVLFTFGDYGVTWDESFHVRYGDGVLEYITSGFTDREAYRYLDLQYYGAAFDLVCAVGTRLSPLALYDTRHLLNAFVALVGVLGCWFLARELGGVRTAFIAALVLMLTPRWWGHGFNNPKDIPFAVGYVWSTYCLVRLLPVLPRVPNSLALKTGLAIGMTLAIRVGGLMLFGYLGLAVLLSFPKTLADIKALSLGAAKIVATAWLVMLAFWPWAQTRPLRAPFEAFEVMSNFTWRGTVLFAGSEIHSTQIPAIIFLICRPQGTSTSRYSLPRVKTTHAIFIFQHSCQSGVGRRHHLHPDGARLRLPGGGYRLVFAPGARLALVQHVGDDFLRGGCERSCGTLRLSRDFQHGSGLSVHRRGFYHPTA